MRAPLLTFFLLSACARAPRRWAVRSEPIAGPAPSPLVAEPVEPAPRAADDDGSIASADGLSRTRPGPCHPETPTAGAEEGVVACTFTADRQWREWRYPEPGALLDVYDGVALIARTTGAGDVDVVRYDIDLGRASTLTLPEPTARWHRAGFTRSGMVVGLARMGTREHPRASWVRGPSDGALAMLALPIDADDLAVEDELAVCVGAHEAVVASALGWSRRIELPANTTAPAAWGEGVRRAGERVRCAAGRCVIDGVARVTVRGRSRGNDPAGGGGL